MVNPFREPPRYLVCPRCGDVLEAIVSGVSMCPRCEGVWLATHVLSLAFGDPQGPAGQVMWWHNELACPECAASGTPSTMDAKSASGVHLDCCAKHGLWLDRGELGRVTSSSGDELAVLLRRLEANVDPAALAERRTQWRGEQRSQKEALGAALDAHGRALEEARRARRVELLNSEAELEQQRQKSGRAELVARHHDALATVARLEAKIAALRFNLDQRTGELSNAKRVLAALQARVEAG